MRRTTLSGLALALVLGQATLLVGSEKEVAPAPRVELGQQAPDFILPTTDGHTLRLEILQGDKPLVLTFFRGTW